MNAIQFLKQQHQEAKAGFGKIEEAAPEQRGGLWKKLKPELPLHEQLEEKCLYDPLARDAKGKIEKLVGWDTRHHQQVQEVEALIEKLEGLDAKSAEWLHQLTTIKSTLEGHIREEERDVWPKIREVWDGARLEEAGREMETMKKAKLKEVA
jgi:iron-sulfur cluster repair protein YtfE (RIC family)